MPQRRKPQQKKNNWIPGALMLVGAALVLGVVIALTAQNRPAAQSAPTARAQAPAEGEEVFPGVERVTIEEAKAALDEGSAVFLDVRGPAAFNAGRIPGSTLIPINELETRWTELDPADWIITYCT